MKRIIYACVSLVFAALVVLNYKNGWWLDRTLVGGAVFAAIYLGLNGWAKFIWEITKSNDL